MGSRGMSRGGRMLGVAAGVSAIAVLLVSASVAVAARAPVTRGVCRAPRIRPGVIDLAVDGSSAIAGYRRPGHVRWATARLPRMRWSTWRARSATARAYQWISDGYPSIGGSTLYAIRVDIRLWRPIAGVFRRMTVISHARRSFRPNRFWRNPPRRRTFRAQSCGSGRWSW